MSDSEFGSDGQIHSTEGSFATFADAERSLDASDSGSSAQRLRAFEDEHLGPDTPRFGGMVEKGHGSLFSRLPPEKQKAHALIEKTAETEAKVDAARANLAIAENEHAAACRAADIAAGLD